EAGARLHEAGARPGRGLACLHLLRVVEVAGFDYRLYRRIARSLDHPPDILLDGPPIAGLGRPEIDHHVYLAGSLRDGEARLGRFGLGSVRSEGEADHRTDEDAGA